MDAHLFAAFALAALIIQLVPGPGMLFLVATGISRGPRAGIAAAVGAAMGVVIQATATAFGLAALFRAVPLALDVLKIVGAGYLVWLAVQAFRAPSLTVGADGDGRAVSAVRMGARSLVNNLTNPKIALFVVGFLPQFVDQSRGHVTSQLLVLGFALAVIGLAVDVVIGALSGRIGAVLRVRPRLGVHLNRTAGVLYVGLAGRLLAD
ncbi:LysE family translocator [Yinghuangia seranimata]|uniref:LysE family translocator n=1 Tax=Yinghuangia seranimata TaxID=408067 RepID=UPI00248B4F9C|nr:LysE family translocator [Yinghuangia seranimata]MDI2127711.1 LysE family translocator [Yinghuangia seranimata]